MSLINRLFAGSSRGWDYPDRIIKFSAPTFDRYRLYGDSPIPTLSLVHNRTNMTEHYITNYLLPRANIFDKLAEGNREIASIAKDKTHPISILASKRASFLIDDVIKKDPKSFPCCSIDDEARAFASCCLLVVDGFTVSLVEKQFSGFSLKTHRPVIKQVCRDFLVSITVRNWIGDTGRDIGKVINRQLESVSDTAPPPFSPSPFDPVWRYFRYLIDYGFFCGIDYLEKGRQKFERAWAPALKPREKS